MKKRQNKRQMTGMVFSNRMDKTVTVMVERLVKHKLYHKYIKRRSKFTAHDETNSCQVGDKIVITESRPLSRNKRWRVNKILEKAI